MRATSGDVTTERRVHREECVLGGRVVVLVMMGGGGVLLACSLVHHRSGAISCNIYQLTQETSGWPGGGGRMQQTHTHAMLVGCCYGISCFFSNKKL